MVEVVKFKAEHAYKIQEQKATSNVVGSFREETIKLVEQLPYSRTLIFNDEILLVGGANQLWNGRAEVWAILAEGLKSKFLIVHKAVIKFFDDIPFKRLEATVDLNFKEAHRWMDVMGFKLEAPVLKSFFPDGSDGALYAKVRL